jgi:16S rRNA (guanine966-N2)-methyltransferase
MGRKTAVKPSRGVRIIGGTWRGRRLPVASLAGLRPTPDRVRETLFNWLAARIAGARCLDLFAGTGVLGLEALSRGAAQAVFVESSAELIASLRRATAALSADCLIYQAQAIDYLKTSQDSFDVVFLDPPYQQAVPPLLALLAGHLRAGAVVYVERPSEGELQALACWGSLLKSGRAGAVHYGLLQVDGSG